MAGKLQFYPQVSSRLQEYVRDNVFPRYDAYDKAHSRTQDQEALLHPKKAYCGAMDGATVLLVLCVL